MHYLKRQTFYGIYNMAPCKKQNKRQGCAKKLVFSLPRPTELDTRSHISLGRVNIASCLHWCRDKKNRDYNVDVNINFMTLENEFYEFIRVVTNIYDSLYGDIAYKCQVEKIYDFLCFHEMFQNYCHFLNNKNNRVF